MKARGWLGTFIWNTYHKIKRWINDHEPFYCLACNRVRFIGGSRVVRHTSAGTVRICQECYIEHYEPWKKEGIKNLDISFWRSETEFKKAYRGNFDHKEKKNNE